MSSITDIPHQGSGVQEGWSTELDNKMHLLDMSSTGKIEYDQPTTCCMSST